ncbi:MFS general substrate transporter [Hypomontagnella monticulosa]|nr:MFS general substrate transporter [Hypomontagnella monticulosa]
MGTMDTKHDTMDARNDSESISKGEDQVQISGPLDGGDDRQKDTATRKFLRIIWDSLDKSPEERKFINKVDCWIMTYICVAYFVKYLDQTNVVNAYVSGMKEDLHMAGQDYNLLQTMFTVGYCLGNLPSQLAMTKIRPSVWLPSLELIWGVLVMAMAGAKNVQTLYGLRFVIGFLEASAYPGILTLLGNWYTPQELGKRSAIFIASSAVAQMFSGYLQAGLYSGMNGKHGLAAWQWLFIFDGIITVPVAAFGFWAIPDSPVNSKARWLKPEQRAMAIARMERVGRKPPAKLQWKIVGEIFRMWPVYLFSIVFASQLLGMRIINYFTIYLKSTGLYTVEQVNIIPTGAYGLQVVTTLIYAWLSDGIGKRPPSIVIAASISLIGCIILSIYPENNHPAMMAGWFLTYAQMGASALILTLLNETLSFSNEHRLVVIGIVETFGFVMNAWVILLAYPSGEAPKFSVGYEMAAMFFSLEIVGITAIWFCNKKWKPSLPNQS